MKLFTLIQWSGIAAFVFLMFTAFAGEHHWRTHGLLAGFTIAAAFAHIGLIVYKWFKTRPKTVTNKP